MLWLHAGALALALAALLGLHNGAVTVPDEGVYLLQAKNLVGGSWASEIPAADVDTEGLFVAVTDGAVVDGQSIPYSKHPIYPLLLIPFFVLGGPAAALALSIIGTWGAAVAAAFVARRLNPSYGPWALWITGFGSPLLFDSQIAVAHSLGAASAGLAFLGLARVVDGRRFVHLAYALPAIATMIALRGEGLILAAALSVAIGLLAVSRSNGWRVDGKAVGVALLVACTTALTLVVELVASNAINGTGTSATGPTSRLSNDHLRVLRGVWTSLFRPFSDSWADVQVFIPIASAGVIMAALILKVMPHRPLLPLALLVSAALFSIGLVAAEPQLITGLVAAFPLLPAGLILLRSKDLSEPLAARALLSSCLFAAAILAVNYSIGGAAEWGGRFFHLLLPILVPIAIRGLDNGRAHLTLTEARVAIGALILLCLMFSLSSVRAQVDNRHSTKTLVRSTLAFADSRADRPKPLIVVSRLYGDGAPRAFWNEIGAYDVVSSASLQHSLAVLNAAHSAGRTDIVVSTNVSPELFSFVISDALEELGWNVTNSSFDRSDGIYQVWLERV